MERSLALGTSSVPRIEAPYCRSRHRTGELPGPDGAGLQVPGLRGLRPHPVVLLLAVVPTDLGTAYAYHRRVLRLLQWGAPARPWRLKAPAHRVGIAALASAFPDARFVMTHRDVVEVIRR